MSTRPTKEEILKKPRPKHRYDVLAYVREWKRTDWRLARHHEPGQRFAAIRYLVHRIADMYEHPVTIHWHPNFNGSSYYDSWNGVIILAGRPSIITALHELGHHLFGRSERQACRWSVWLFRKTFPLAYVALVWRGHMLVRPEPNYPVLKCHGHVLVLSPKGDHDEN